MLITTKTHFIYSTDLQYHPFIHHILQSQRMLILACLRASDAALHSSSVDLRQNCKNCRIWQCFFLHHFFINAVDYSNAILFTLLRNACGGWYSTYMGTCFLMNFWCLSWLQYCADERSKILPGSTWNFKIHNLWRTQWASECLMPTSTHLCIVACSLFSDINTPPPPHQLYYHAQDLCFVKQEDGAMILSRRPKIWDCAVSEDMVVNVTAHCDTECWLSACHLDFRIRQAAS